jgi:hypothetical protein
MEGEISGEAQKKGMIDPMKFTIAMCWNWSLDATKSDGFS